MPNIAATLSLNVPAITALCKGDPGTSLLNGPAAPTTLVGNEGDFYIQTANSGYVVYGPKNYGEWGEGVALTNSASAGIWNNTYTTLWTNSGKWNTAYTYLGANSGTITFVNNNSAVVINSFSTLTANSASWVNSYRTLTALSASWDSGTSGSVYNTMTANSANWDAVYATVYGTSAVWNAGGGGGGDYYVNALVRANSSVWDYTVEKLMRPVNAGQTPVSAYILYTVNSFTQPYSSNLIDVQTRVATTSSNWDYAYSSVSTALAPLSTPWITTFNQVSSLSGSWSNVYTSVKDNSGYWDNAWTISNNITSVSADRWSYTWRNIYDTGANGTKLQVIWSPAGTYWNGYAEFWTACSLIAATGMDVWNANASLLYAVGLSGTPAGYVATVPGNSPGAPGYTVTVTNRSFQIPYWAQNGILSAGNVTAGASYGPGLTAVIPAYVNQGYFPVGWKMDLLQGSATQVVISAGFNNVLWSKGGVAGKAYTNGQYSVVSIRKIADNGSSAEWIAYGDLSTTYTP